MKQWRKEEIKGLRKYLGLTQKEFAKMLGVTRVYIMMLETGRKQPSELLKKLFDCLEEKHKRG